MIIATWNVNGFRARATRIREWLAERKPDVVCLQELKVKEEEFSHEHLEELGYHAAIVGQQGWNGVAVVAREKPEVVMRELPGAAAGSGARFLTVRASGIEVASVYIPNGKTTAHPEFKQKLEWLEKLTAHIEGVVDANKPFVLAGDFNVCWTDLDSYLGARGHGAIFHTDEERGFLNRMRAAGLVDLYRSVQKEEPGYSWWDYRAGAFHRKLGMRLDLLLATPPVAERVQEVFVDREFRKKSKISGALPSDHAPVVARLS